MPPPRRRARAEDELRFGRRRDRSRRSLRRAFRRAAELTRELPKIRLETDKKACYVGLAIEAFGDDRVVHGQTSSRLARTISNPLFRINHTESMTRDLTGRLRSEQWLSSKRQQHLDF